MKTPFPTNRTSMQVSIEMILKARGHLQNFNTPNGNGVFEFHLRIENPPYMPLVIERHGAQVMISHYFMQNGDVMSDPEIVFSLPFWEATEITQSPLGIWRQKYPVIDGKRMISRTFTAEVMPLANLWATNLRDQGFVHGGIATSLTHPTASTISKKVA